MKRHLIPLCMLIGFSVIPTGCTKQIYHHALLQAAHPTPAKVFPHLTEITKENPDLQWKRFEDMSGVIADYVLVVSWKKAKDTMYYHNDTPGAHAQEKFYATKSRPIYVTVFPDLQKWYSHEEFKGNLNKRLAQLLGLPPDTAHRVFITFWVRPQDLFRPCIDPEVTDNSCDFKLNTTTSSSTNAEHLAWLTEYSRNSYCDSTLYNQYPFTQLGYTYDWKKKNKQHIGLSEFVIGKNAFVKMAGIYSAEAFLHWDGL